MKTKTKILTCLPIGASLLFWLGCESLESRHVVDRIPPETPSVEAVNGGYDTVGRMWSEEDLARMRRSKKEKEMAAASAPVSKPEPARAAPVERSGPVESKPGRPVAPVTVSSIEVKAGTVNLTIQAPTESGVGETFCYDLTVTAIDNVTNVFVEQTLAEGLILTSSEPQGAQNGKTLVWNYPRLSKGEKKAIKVCVQATKSAAISSCATVYTKPMYCASTMIGKAVLTIRQSGPQTVLINSNATYTAVIKNTGDAIARNVVVTDIVPEGLSHQGGKNTVTVELGNLAPNESKTVPVTLKAMQRGKPCNVMEVVAANADKVSDKVCTTVLQPSVKIAKTGPAKQFINKPASYKVVVSNVGDTDVTGLTVTDTAPAGTTFISTEGTQASGNTAVWKNVSLKKGEERTFNVTLLNRNKGEYCNVATVATSTGEREEAKACTQWLGVSALLLEVVDDPDPLLVDEQTTYTIRVTNQGTAEVGDLSLSATFSKQLVPVSAENGTVQGSSVKFNAAQNLAPKATLTFKMKAKAVSIGDGRVRVSLGSDILETPVTKEESTRVY